MSRLISLAILVGMVVVLVILFYQVMVGFMLSLFLATLLTVLFQPLFRWVQRLCHGHERPAAAITTTAVLLIVLVPVGLILFEGAVEANRLLSERTGAQLDHQSIQKFLDDVNARFDQDPKKDQVMEYVTNNVKTWIQPVVGRTPSFLGNMVIQSLITVLALYYFLSDGPQILIAMSRMIPLDHKYQEELVNKFVEVTRAVASSAIVAAVTQGILIGIGYYLAGFHGVFLLIVLTMLASFVPLVGSAVVWGGACLWLFVDGRMGAAIALLIWSLIIALLADNVLKPIVLHGHAKLHPLLGLLSVLGGVQVLGPLGIFFGPMAVAFLQAGLNMLNAELELLTPHKGRRKQLEKALE